MKKILPIMIILAMTFSAISAVAYYPYYEYDCCWEHNDYESVTTKAVIATCNDGGDDDDDTDSGGSTGDGDSGTNSPPIIKCKWEYDRYAYVNYVDPCECDCTCLEHDSCPCAPGLQVTPVLGDEAWVDYYAVVYDPNGADIEKVYADVWHPDCTFKYQIELELVEVIDAALYEWDHVYKNHRDLITLNEDWMDDMEFDDYDAYDDIEDELREGLGYLYHGSAPIDYCQPGGYYYVGVKARDTFLWSDYLFNTFWYIPTSAISIDFDTVDYKTLNLDTYKRVGGDYDMTTPDKPTVRNIGNTPVDLYVRQDDMGFGRTMVNGDWEWNVLFDARMTADPDPVEYEPSEKDYTLIPGGPLWLCTKEKLDFGITVFKGYCEVDYEGTMDLKASIHLASYVWPTPSKYIEPAPEGVEDIFPYCDEGGE
jgi:hypothetical protein